jgi:hypothetical protein
MSNRRSLLYLQFTTTQIQQSDLSSRVHARRRGTQKTRKLNALFLIYSVLKMKLRSYRVIFNGKLSEYNFSLRKNKKHRNNNLQTLK